MTQCALPAARHIVACAARMRSLRRVLPRQRAFLLAAGGGGEWEGEEGATDDQLR